MKDKGIRADHFPEGTRWKEITRDDRVWIITFRDSAGMSWKEIQHHMGVDFHTCHAIYAQVKVTDTPSNRKRM